MKRMIATSAVALALGFAAPALAQTSAQNSTQASTQTSAPDQARQQGQDQSDGGGAKVVQTERSIPGQPALGQSLDEIKGGGVALVPSQDLTQREVKTAESQSAGKIAYVVVEGDSGQVSYLLTPITGQGDAGQPPQRFRVLPWDSVKQDAQGGMSVDASRDQLSQMPEVSGKEFGKLQDPSFRQQVDQSWRNQDGQTDNQNQQSQGRSQNQGQQQTAQPSLPPGHPPMLLVGPEKTEMLGRDGLPTAAVIVDQQGAEIADLDHVVVDTAHGLVAYTIVSEAGPTEKRAFRASPLSALKWDGDKQAFVAPEGFKDSPAHASAEEAEGSVRSQSQLSDLYEGSGVPPYWQQGQQD